VRAGGAALLLVASLLGACGGGGDSAASNSPPSNAGSTRARFSFDCDLQGLVGQLTMEVEVIAASGAVWGSGPNPSITGVIATGSYTVYTAGELQSSTAHYTFRGENNYADFTRTGASERFTVEWVQRPGGLLIVVNPFGPGPTQHVCNQTGSQFL
jgi:hypothetical protein